MAAVVEETRALCFVPLAILKVEHSSHMNFVFWFQCLFFTFHCTQNLSDRFNNLRSWRQNKKTLGVRKRRRNMRGQSVFQYRGAFPPLPSEILKYTFSCLCRIALFCLHSECGNFPSQTHRGGEINNSDVWLVRIKAAEKLEKLPPF